MLSKFVYFLHTTHVIFYFAGTNNLCECNNFPEIVSICRRFGTIHFEYCFDVGIYSIFNMFVTLIEIGKNFWLGEM